MKVINPTGLPKMEEKTPLEIAVEFFGGQIELARALGISTQAISQWNGEVPELRAYQIHVVSGGEIPLEKLLPNGKTD